MREASEWLDRRGLADYVSVRVDELPRLQKAHKLPAPSYHLGPRSPRWKRADVDAMFGGSSPEPPKSDARRIGAEVVQDILRGRRF